MRISISPFLTIVFIVLKITGYINWGWFYVLLPILIQIFIGVVVAIVLILVKKETNLPKN